MDGADFSLAFGSTNVHDSHMWDLWISHKLQVPAKQEQFSILTNMCHAKTVDFYLLFIFCMGNIVFCLMLSVSKQTNRLFN